MAVKKIFEQTAITDPSNYRFVVGKSGEEATRNITHDYLKTAMQVGDYLPRTLTTSTYDPDADTTYNNVMMPSMCKSPVNGKLVQIFRLGDSHVLSQGRLYGRLSTDNGVTWTGMAGTGNTSLVHEDSNGYDCRNYSVFYTPTGRLVVIFMRYATDGSTWYTTQYMYSDDDGATFNTPVEFDEPVAGTGRLPQPYGNRCVEDTSGNLLIPFAHAVTDASATRLFLAKSTDNGATWDTDYKKIFDGSTDGGSMYLAEPVIEDFGDGVFIIVARNTDPNTAGDKVPVIMYSDDYGENWAGTSESLAYTDFDNSNHNAGHLYLEGASTDLGQDANGNDCLPDIIKMEFANSEWIVIPYWIRNNGVETTVLKVSLINLGDYIENGTSAIVSTVPQEVYNGTDHAQGTKNGGNGTSISIGNDILHATAEQVSNNTAGTNYLVTTPIRSSLIHKMINLYYA